MAVTAHLSALAMAGIVWLWLYTSLGYADAGYGTVVAILLNTVVTLGFVGTVVVHEAAHAFAARRLRLEVVGITLFALGGVTRLRHEPEHPGDEAIVAVAGPVTNLLLGAVALVLARTRAAGDTAIIMELLGQFNAIVGVFNLLPGHPLDGGSLLRAAIWRLRGDRNRAAAAVAISGTALGYAIMAVGLVLSFARDDGSFGDGLWLVLVGLFIANAARAAQVRGTVAGALEGLLAADLARPVTWTALADRPVLEVVVASTHEVRDAVVVDDSGRALGVFGREEFEGVPWHERETTTLRQRMRPFAGSIGADLPARSALERFGGDPKAVLLVETSGGEVYGVLDADRVLHRVEAHRRGTAGAEA